MAFNTPSELKPAVEMKHARGKISDAEKIFRLMRAKISDVFPDDDKEAWQWTGEDFVTHEMEKPLHSFQEWMQKQYKGSDEFTQRFVRRMFTIWQEMEQEGFEANDLELYEHQKALFAWIALESATGVRENIANLLARSPYGSGKSLVSGIVTRAFKETQEEMLAEGLDPKEVPTGVLLGLRKEHMLQNALGEQYAVLQPPYTLERQDILIYWKNLVTIFGEDFQKHFPKPHGKTHPFFALFTPTEEGNEETVTTSMRLEQYRTGLPLECNEGWLKVDEGKRNAILTMVAQLMEGEIVLVPDIYTVPQPERAMPRESAVTMKEARYRGDSAHALEESEHYRVKATHKHLALDRTSYTTEPNLKKPAKFCIAYGTILMRDPELLRADLREEIMKQCTFLNLDEAGKYTPATLGSTVEELTKKWPYIIGFTGHDAGIEGWTKRSPILSIQQMIRLKLMKPIAFQGIGDAKNPTAQGSEEAWEVYRRQMFTDVRTAKKLALPQPHELDTVVIAPTEDVREYAHRIKKEHEKEGVPLKIWCFDPAAKNSRWSIIVNGFNAPKEKGDPKRILVAPPSQIAEALHLHAENYDVLADMSTYLMDQTRGRLGHVRNTAKTKQEQQKARTYFRVQWLDGTTGEAYVREVAKMMGYTLDAENATWPPLQCMIDFEAHERDTERTGLSKAEPIPDAKAIAKRKKRRKRQEKRWTRLRSTSAFVIERDRKKAEREAKKNGTDPDSSAEKHLTNGYTPPPYKADPMREPDPILSQAERAFSVRHERGSISILVAKDGRPVNLFQLAQDFEVREYIGPLSRRVDDAFTKGIRGKNLAKVVRKELRRLQDIAARRSGEKTKKDGKDMSDDKPDDSIMRAKINANFEVPDDL